MLLEEPSGWCVLDRETRRWHRPLGILGPDALHAYDEPSRAELRWRAAHGSETSFWHQFLVSSLEMHVVGLQASDVVVAEREFYYLR